jgi:ATP-dependent Zn protease
VGDWECPVNNRGSIKEKHAYHEAGHAVVSMKLGYKCLYITIIPDGSRLGHVCCEDPSLERATTRSNMH